jgi:NifU-like protein
VELKDHGVELPEHKEEGRIVCKCFSISEPHLRSKIKELNLRTIPEITNALKAGGACMTCHHAPGGLQDLLDETWGRPKTEVRKPSPPARSQPATQQGDDAEDGGLSPYQFSKKVEKLIDDYVRPMLKRDGGDIEIVDIKERVIYAHLVGACSSCPGASMTLKMMVEQTLKNQVDERIRVIAV